WRHRSPSGRPERSLTDSSPLPAATRRLAACVRASRRALVIGIGGGGDVIGALASALFCERLGVPAVLGGVTWERRPIDPEPGPRSASEILGARSLHDAALLAGPETR